jgi:hypothetical protein
LRLFEKGGAVSVKDKDEQEYEQQQQHIEELKEQVARISGIPDCTYLSPACPDDVTEKFLEYVLAFEDREQRPLFDALIESGVGLPAPDQIGDAQLSSKLWEVIHAMSLFGHYLYNTNHLSDRELYERLWTDTLPEPTTLIPENPNFACHIDLVGTGSMNDVQLYLKYYADEEERQRWATDWPDDTIPPHENPPYDRDRHLP